VELAVGFRSLKATHGYLFGKFLKKLGPFFTSLFFNKLGEASNIALLEPGSRNFTTPSSFAQAPTGVLRAITCHKRGVCARGISFEFYTSIFYIIQ